jgi:DNA-binding transcriptional ArsR family regulator
VLSERVASPRELAEAFGEPLGRVSHHVRSLAASGHIELVRTRPRRGAVEHFYRTAGRPALSDEEWSQLSPERRQDLGVQLLREVWTSALAAADAGALTADDVHLSRTALVLDEPARRELDAALVALVEQALRLQAESEARLGDAPGRRSELSLLHVDRPG